MDSERERGQPGIVGTFPRQLLTAASNSFQLLKAEQLALHIVSFETARASISLLVAEVSNQKVVVQVFSVLTANQTKQKKKINFRSKLNR